MLAWYKVLYRNIESTLSERDSDVDNPLPDDKILDWFKLKQTAGDILDYI